MHTNSPEETAAYVIEAMQTAPGTRVVAFFGELGTGKTSSIRLICQRIARVTPDLVHSPTFQYLHIYPGTVTVYHFDLYRLRGIDDFLHMGFEEVFTQPGLVFIEWAERIQDLLPKGALLVTLSHAGGSKRTINLSLQDGYEHVQN